MKEREEELVVKVIGAYFCKMYDAKMKVVVQHGDTYLWVASDKFDVVMTVCETDKITCVKIEELEVNKKFRKKGLGTELIKAAMEICKIHKCVLGLWCEKSNKKAFKFYDKLGFEHVDTKRDYWLEYK